MSKADPNADRRASGLEKDGDDYSTDNKQISCPKMILKSVASNTVHVHRLHFVATLGRPS